MNTVCPAFPIIGKWCHPGSIPGQCNHPQNLTACYFTVPWGLPMGDNREQKLLQAVFDCYKLHKGNCII